MKKIILSLLISALAIPSVFGLNPKKEYEFTPGDFGMQYEEVTIATSDKLNLKGWLLEPMTNHKKCIVFSHNGEGNMSDYIEEAANFVSLGYWVLMYDYRGYGASDSFKINNKFFIYSQFAIDVTAALDWVKKYKAVFTVDMYGMGIGAGLSISVGANRSEVGYVIADGAYSSFEKVQRSFEEAEGIKVMLPFGYDKVYMEPVFALEAKGEHLEGILLIISDKDPVIKEADAQEIADLKKRISKIYVVDSESNRKNFQVNKDAYFKEIKAFLKL